MDEGYRPPPVSPFQPTTWVGIAWFWGIPAVILGTFMGMFTGLVPSPITKAAQVAEANFDILTARNHLFEEMVFFDANNCVHTARGPAEEQLCFAAADNACRELDKIQTLVEKAHANVKAGGH